MSSAPRASSRESSRTKIDITVIRATVVTTAVTTSPRTSTRSGSVAPTYIAGPTRANTAVASAGTVPLAKFSVEKAAKKYRSPVTTRARDIHTRARRSRSAETSIRHHVWTRSAQPCTSAISPLDVRVGVRHPDGTTADDDHQADEVDGVSPAEPRVGGERGRGEHRHREHTRERTRVVVPRGQQQRGRDGGAPGEDEEGGGDQRPSPQQESHARRGGGHRDDRQRPGRRCPCI